MDTEQEKALDTLHTGVANLVQKMMGQISQWANSQRTDSHEPESSSPHPAEPTSTPGPSPTPESTPAFPSGTQAYVSEPARGGNVGWWPRIRNAVKRIPSAWRSLWNADTQKQEHSLDVYREQTVIVEELASEILSIMEVNLDDPGLKNVYDQFRAGLFNLIKNWGKNYKLTPTEPAQTNLPFIDEPGESEDEPTDDKSPESKPDEQEPKVKPKPKPKPKVKPKATPATKTAVGAAAEDPDNLSSNEKKSKRKKRKTQDEKDAEKYGDFNHLQGDEIPNTHEPAVDDPTNPAIPDEFDVNADFEEEYMSKELPNLQEMSLEERKEFYKVLIAEGNTYLVDILRAKEVKIHDLKDHYKELLKEAAIS